MGTNWRNIDSSPTGLTRRTILKRAAWSAPVIVVAVSTPAAAASTGAVLQISGSAIWSTTHLVVDAYLRKRDTGVPIPDVEVAWIFDTGLILFANTDGTGFARVSVPANEVETDPISVSISYGATVVEQPVLGTRPPS